VASSEYSNHSGNKKNEYQISSKLVNKWKTIRSFNSEMSSTIVHEFLYFMSVAPET